MILLMPAHSGILRWAARVSASSQPSPNRWLSYIVQLSVPLLRRWLIVAFHEPYYTTQSSNSLSNYFQNHLESVFYQHAVDLVFSGHIHAYERSYPVYNNAVRAS